MQRLHDKVSGNWQKFTTVTMVNEINKSRDLKENGKSHLQKVFESTIMTEKIICTLYFLQKY